MFRRRVQTVRDVLHRHFGQISTADVEVHSRQFPYRVCVDAYLALTKWMDDNVKLSASFGVPIVDSFMSSTGIATLLAPSDDNQYYPTSLEFESFDIGDEAPATCVKHGLWLVHRDGEAMAILWTSTTSHHGCGFETRLRLDVAHVTGQSTAALTQELFRQIEQSIKRAASYRGKILSLESSASYSGRSSGMVVHRLRRVDRDDVILPDSTVRLLERNIIRFVEQRPQLAKLGMPTKKGVLFYGPPGTGKTHTIHYLLGALQGHTTLLVTAEQVALLDEYVALARLLEPSIVVLEDADLIGHQRQYAEVGRELLLNKMLNEMDGLRADAEILFVLTTNRPESLEPALAARPGRIDQAIEFPLPDDSSRRKLIRLYAAGAIISEEVVGHTTRITQSVSGSFIKELMRRAVQFQLESCSNDRDLRILQNDVDQAIEELLFVGGSLNRALLGAEGAASGE